MKPFIDELKILYIKIEYDWFKVAEGEVTEKEINQLLFDYKKQFSEIESKYLNEEILIENLEYRNLADQKVTKYFENNF